MLKYLKSKRGDSVITAPFAVLLVMFLTAFFIKVSPVIVRIQNLNTYANELCRVAELSGRVGSETTEKEKQLNKVMGMSPEISWSKTGTIQLNETVSVTCSTTYELGLFGDIGSYPVAINGHAEGSSEVYHK
ncbi:hypothetical protein CAFE_11300 [Caprobacter fermentans]|uniref:DUF4320 family protein n=1 Tax=Caproicibacter fermentans TaxID=2576756 RepID=A0A6N8HX74_9FIRM|nr:DUF4320 family protein [Caproicibacter fermentans]MVB10441.1 hypothetical protein [Caproicibacter fermentans]